jgi:hypothetical protein
LEPYTKQTKITHQTTNKKQTNAVFTDRSIVVAYTMGRVGMAELVSSVGGSVMSASNGELIVNGQQRDLIVQAAMAYDETQKRIASLEDQLRRAVAVLEAKNLEIDNLNLLLSQERNRNDNYRKRARSGFR